MQTYISSHYFCVGILMKKSRNSVCSKERILKNEMLIVINCKVAAWSNGAKVRRSKNNLLDE